MAELLTYAQAKESRELKKVSGVCSSSDEFKSLLNQATRKLTIRGPGERAWWGTVKNLQICNYNGCFTWPAFVSTPLAINTYGHSTPVQNNWFSFLPFNKGDWNRGGFFGLRDGCCRGNVVAENSGTSPVFNNVACGAANYIRVYPASRLDVGKVVTIYGIDSNGQIVRTLRSDGTYQDGEQLTISLPYVSSSKRFQKITRVEKPVTQNVVRLYQYDATNDVLLDCATYQSWEQNPNYRQTKIHNLRPYGNCAVNSCNGLISFQAMVKLEFIPVVNDSDLVLITNLDALQAMMLSVRNFEQGNTELSREMEAAAIRELNLELEDKIPTEQSAIDILAFGTALPRYAGVGMM